MCTNRYSSFMIGKKFLFDSTLTDLMTFQNLIYSINVTHQVTAQLWLLIN